MALSGGFMAGFNPSGILDAAVAQPGIGQAARQLNDVTRAYSRYFGTSDFNTSTALDRVLNQGIQPDLENGPTKHWIYRVVRGTDLRNRDFLFRIKSPNHQLRAYINELRDNDVPDNALAMNFNEILFTDFQINDYLRFLQDKWHGSRKNAAKGQAANRWKTAQHVLSEIGIQIAGMANIVESPQTVPLMTSEHVYGPVDGPAGEKFHSVDIMLDGETEVWNHYGPRACNNAGIFYVLVYAESTADLAEMQGHRELVHRGRPYWRLVKYHGLEIDTPPQKCFDMARESGRGFAWFKPAYHVHEYKDDILVRVWKSIWGTANDESSWKLNSRDYQARLFTPEDLAWRDFVMNTCEDNVIRRSSLPGCRTKKWRDQVLMSSPYNMVLTDGIEHRMIMRVRLNMRGYDPVVIAPIQELVSLDRERIQAREAKKTRKTEKRKRRGKRDFQAENMSYPFKVRAAQSDFAPGQPVPVSVREVDSDETEEAQPLDGSEMVKQAVSGNNLTEDVFHFFSSDDEDDDDNMHLAEDGSIDEDEATEQPARPAASLEPATHATEDSDFNDLYVKVPTPEAIFKINQTWFTSLNIGSANRPITIAYAYCQQISAALSNDEEFQNKYWQEIFLIPGSTLPANFHWRDDPDIVAVLELNHFINAARAIIRSVPSSSEKEIWTSVAYKVIGKTVRDSVKLQEALDSLANIGQAASWSTLALECGRLLLLCMAFAFQAQRSLALDSTATGYYYEDGTTGLTIFDAIWKRYLPDGPLSFNDLQLITNLRTMLGNHAAEARKVILGFPKPAYPYERLRDADLNKALGDRDFQVENAELLGPTLPAWWERGTGISPDKVPENNRRILENKITGRFEETKVLGDGNCMFESLSNQLPARPGKAAVRKQVVAWLNENQNLRFNNSTIKDFVVTDGGFEPYVAKIAQDGTWGDHLCLVAAANVYDVAIVIVSSIQGGETAVIAPFEPGQFTGTIFLAHEAEYHYTSLHPFDDFAKTIFGKNVA